MTKRRQRDAVRHREAESTAAKNGRRTGVNPQDGGSRQPRMRESANQGSANAPSKDVQSRQSSMSDSDKQASANAPRMDGAIPPRQYKDYNKDYFTEYSKNTTETTTTDDAATSASSNVAAHGRRTVGVVVAVDDLPSWLVDEFRFFLGDERVVNGADLASLRALAEYPEYIVLQAFDAAQAWLQTRAKGQSTVWGVGCWARPKRKAEDEQQRGNSVARAPGEDEDSYRRN